MNAQMPQQLQASKPGAEDIPAMNARNWYLEKLYVLDGRNSSDHPQAGSYVGLIAKYGYVD